LVSFGFYEKPINQYSVDSISQIALGAAMGELAAGKKAGNKAMIWGAVGGTIPDLDVIGGAFLDPISNLVFHRGFTHSFWFAFVMAPILGYLLHYFYKRRDPNVSYRDWTWLFFLALFTHPLLDCFTTWGTQFFTPFSDFRVAFNTIFVLDPLYTVPFSICLIFAATFNRAKPKRKYLNYLGIALSTGYILFTVVNKQYVDGKFQDSMDKKGMGDYEFMSAPTPLNNLLWHASVKSEDTIWVGYYSILDKNDNIRFQAFSRNLYLKKPYENSRAFRILKHVSKDFYALRQIKGGIQFYDLRFGLLDGWKPQNNDSINLPFHWKIFEEKNPDGTHKVLQQRPDFEVTDELLQTFVDRVKGEKP
jgi:inner membrane protein